MRTSYGYSLDREAVAKLLQCSGRERSQLIDAIEGIAFFPHVAGDFTQSGPDGRNHQVMALDDFVVTFWTDHAVKTVRILLIERL